MHGTLRLYTVRTAWNVLSLAPLALFPCPPAPPPQACGGQEGNHGVPVGLRLPYPALQVELGPRSAGAGMAPATC